MISLLDLPSAVPALGHTRRLAGQHRSGGGLGVWGVGLAATAQVAALRPLDLEHRYLCGLQVAGQPGAVAARTLHAGATHVAKSLRPTEEAFVTLLGRRNG